MIDSFTGAYAFLSNFYASPILMFNRRYSTVEHAFQAAKTTDATMQESIRLARDPGRAKQMGRKVELRDDWLTFRMEVMEELLRRKFAHPDLREKLIATHPHELIEGNGWGDQFWGMVKDRKQGWVGENHLGKLLMKIRDEVMPDESIAPTETIQVTAH